MTKENNRVMPTAAEVFRRSHSKLEGSERVMCSKKAKKTVVEFEKRMDDNESLNIQKHPDDVYYEIVGGHKKGKSYGLDDSDGVFYGGSSSRSTNTNVGQSEERYKAAEDLEQVKKVMEEKIASIEDIRRQYEEELSKLRSQPTTRDL